MTKARDIVWGALAVGALATLVSLGAWQLKRAAWKAALIARIEESERAAPAAIGAEPAAQEWHRVVLTGVFLNDRPIRLTGAIRDGKPGTRLLVPFERDGAPIVLVDRGFVPMGETLIRQETAPLTVTGRLRLPPEAPLIGPMNQPDLDLWYRVDPPVMARYRDLGDIAPYYVELAAGPADLPPYPGYAAADLPNNHMQYAFTWFGLAATLVGVSFFSWRARRLHGPQG